MMAEPTKVVDSWDLLVWLLDQPAAPKVESFLQESEAGALMLLMSWISVGEVYYVATRRQGPAKADRFLEQPPSLLIRIILPDEDDIIAAAGHKSSRWIAYADDFAVFLAMRESATVVAGDAE